MANVIKRKKIRKWIREQCKKLPDMNYIALPKEFGIHPLKRHKRKVEKEWYDVPTEYLINHSRRAWRLYKKLGLSGVDYYFKLFGWKLNSLEFEKIE